MSRNAGDAMLVLNTERDARRVLKAPPIRYAKLGLTSHPAKMFLVRFTMPRFSVRETDPEASNSLVSIPGSRPSAVPYFTPRARCGVGATID